MLVSSVESIFPSSAVSELKCSVSDVKSAAQAPEGSRVRGKHVDETRLLFFSLLTSSSSFFFSSSKRARSSERLSIRSEQGISMIYT